jgi:hypothetical protein
VVLTEAWGAPVPRRQEHPDERAVTASLHMEEKADGPSAILRSRSSWGAAVILG